MTTTLKTPRHRQTTSYASTHATANEDILYEARTHWWIFAPGLLLMALSAVPFAAASETGSIGPENPVQIWGIILLGGALLVSLRAALHFLTTDITVSNQRIQVKSGFISRKTLELKLSKLESLSVSQSLIGRLAGFGTIEVRGTGGGNMKLPLIANAMQLRQETYSALESLEA